VERVGFEQCSFSSSIIAESLDGKIGGHKAGLGRGFTSHPVHFYHLVKYGIVLNWILTIVGQKPTQSACKSDRKKVMI
jgi:hypothetical protein